MRNVISTILLTFLLGVTAVAGDLYKVKVSSDEDAARLRSTGAEPILRINDGYLVTADVTTAAKLNITGLTVQFIAANIEKNQLAIDNRLDRFNVGKFPLIYEDDNLRIYRIESDIKTPLQLAPILTERMDFTFSPTAAVDISQMSAEISLDSLINLVLEDSLYSYTSRLQAFYRRYIGTDSNRAAANWIISKFNEFGYDSVVLDSFYVTSYSKWAHNVLCYKIGTDYPLHHIIVGAHRDAVSNSPGADDNGSGTAGVLEIARALSGVETKMTYVFALFDAEEQGLIGSWDYANAAKARGDSIVYMLNMDMIAYLGNDGLAKLYYGSNTTYTTLWQTLADSLVNINGVFYGSSGGSDHYPFIQNGYQATFVHEYNFSTVYHSPLDSTTYMNFEYMTRMVKASLATVYTVNNIYVPTGIMTVEYPSGLPAMLSPLEPTSFDVVVSGTYSEQPLPGSGRLFYSIGAAAYVDIPMTENSPNNYTATLPAADCMTRVDYYIRVRDTASEPYFDPDPSMPHRAMVGTTSIPLFQDNFQTNLGWLPSGTATAGHWQRGTPVGGGLHGDPISDYDGSGMCYLTGNSAGDSDVDNGTALLNSPMLNMTAFSNILVSFALWYSNHSGTAPLSDVFKVYVSNDNGVNWALVQTIGPSYQTTGGWRLRSFWIDDYYTPTERMKIRFEASDLGSASTVEAAVDAVSLTIFECQSFVCGDANESGDVNILDVTFLINYLYKLGAAPTPPGAGDANGSGTINILDATYILNFLYKSGPEPICP